MYDFVYEDHNSTPALAQVIRDNLLAIHPKGTWMRGVAVFTNERKLVELFPLVVGHEGNKGEFLYGDSKDLWPTLVRLVRSTGEFNFMIFVIAREDGDLKKPAFVQQAVAGLQFTIDVELPDKLACRGTVLVGPEGTTGLLPADHLMPTPGSPSYSYAMAQMFLEANEKNPGKVPSIMVDQLRDEIAALEEHREPNETLRHASAQAGLDELGKRGLDLPPEIARLARLVGLTPSAPMAASPFDLPALRPDNGKAQLN